MSGNQDQSTLRHSVYATPDGLAARASVYNWQAPRVDLPRSALTALGELPPGAVVLDAGCGRGQYVRALTRTHASVRCVALDLSRGMAESSRGPRIHPLVGSVDALPLRDCAVDAALAMHMLYHVPDPVAALIELRRVVKPGGTVLASTNDDLEGSLQQLFVRAGVYAAPASDHWPLRAAAEAARTAGLADVSTQAFEYQLTIPESAPVLAYLDSCRAGADIDDGSWVSSRDQVRRQVEKEIARAGVFVAHGRVGFIVGRRG